MTDSPTAKVEQQADPSTPGRVAYRITGRTADAVQDAITQIMDRVDEDAGGYAEFYGPSRIATGYGALGHVTMQPAVSL